LIETCSEFPVHSIDGARRQEFFELGLTDAVILYLFAMDLHGIGATLLTADTRLANCAHALGYSVIDYRQDFLSA
jgi:hypothetical protein